MNDGLFEKADNYENGVFENQRETFGLTRHQLRVLETMYDRIPYLAARSELTHAPTKSAHEGRVPTEVEQQALKIAELSHQVKCQSGLIRNLDEMLKNALTKSARGRGPTEAEQQEVENAPTETHAELIKRQLAEHEQSYAEWARIEYRYSNGSIRAQGSYHNGLRDGTWNEFYPNGKLYSQAHYKDGRLVGEVGYFEQYERPPIHKI